MAGQRKKHGHLMNMAGEFDPKLKTKDGSLKRGYKDHKIDLNRKNLDAMNIPYQVECLFPEKVKVFEKMRALEREMNDFMSQKLLSIKEDLLATSQQAKIKRMLKMML